MTSMKVVTTVAKVQLKQFKTIENVKKTIDLDKQWWCGGNYGGWVCTIKTIIKKKE